MNRGRTAQHRDTPYEPRSRREARGTGLGQRRMEVVTPHAAWMVCGYGLRLALQAAALILLARALGPADFGLFIAAFAVGVVMASATELGAYSLIVRDHVIGRSVRVATGQSLVVVAALLPVGLFAIGLGQAFVKAPIPIPQLLLIAGGTALSASVSNVCRAVHVATGQFPRYAVLEVLGGGLLFSFALVLYGFDAGIGAWTILFLVYCVLISGIAIAAVAVRWGMPKWEQAGLRARLKPGAQFAIASTAQLGLTEIDKLILAHAASLGDAGVYGATQRIVHAAFVPLIAALGTTYRRFFEHGREGLPAAGAFAERVVPAVIVYGLIVACVLWVAAPGVAVLLGPGFEGAKEALRVLAPLVVVLGLQLPLGDALTGSDLQGARTTAHAAALALNLLLNLWLIPVLGWYGAAASAWVTHLALLVLLSVLVFRLHIGVGRDRRAALAEPGAEA